MGFGRKPPPPPPPPPPPRFAELHQEHLLQTAGCAAALAALLQLLLILRLRSRVRSTRRPLVSVAGEPRQAGRPAAFVTLGESELGVHTRRLLAERGYAVSYSADSNLPAGLTPAVVVHVASEAPGLVGPARTTAAVAAACEALSPAPKLVLVSDARAGCDPTHDVSDGDIEMEDPTHSHADARHVILLVCVLNYQHMYSTS